MPIFEKKIAYFVFGQKIDDFSWKNKIVPEKK